MSAKVTGSLFVATSVMVGIAFCVVASVRTLTGLENVLLQLFTLGTGLVGSYIYGRASARDAARELVKPHARSAFRRLLSLYRGLSRLLGVIESARQTSGGRSLNSPVLDSLEATIVEQISTANDALDEWQDVVPEDVAELRARFPSHPVENGK